MERCPHAENEIREAFRVFRADLGRCEVEVLRVVKTSLAPHEFDALVSFHCNTAASRGRS